MLRAAPKSTTNTTTGVAWDDSYASNNSASNIRKMVTGSESNPFGIGITDTSFKYDPKKPLYDGRNESGFGAYITKEGNRFKRHYKYMSGTRYGPIRSYGSHYIDPRVTDVYTGKTRKPEPEKILFNENSFDKYFGNYLKSMG